MASGPAVFRKRAQHLEAEEDFLKRINGKLNQKDLSAPPNISGKKLERPSATTFTLLLEIALEVKQGFAF